MLSISFVIPTLNFAAFLPAALDSIIDEGYAPIDIIVFDGGSTDNTLEVLEAYRLRFPALRVIVATERGNIDIDLNKAVDAATGDYVWTVSADDALMPGWSRTIADLLERDDLDLLLVPAVHCDIKMQPRRDYPILKDTGQGPLRATIANDNHLLAYLDQVRTSEGMFSFCTACLVRRSRLLRVPGLEAVNGTCWRYSVRLIAVLTDYPSRITVLDAPLIHKRGDNDSFAHAGAIRRLKIATLNWDDAIGSLGRNRRISAAMLALVKSDIRPVTLLYLSQLVRNRDELAMYRACVDTRMRDDAGQVSPLGRVLKAIPRFPPLRKGLETAKAGVRVIQQRRWAARLPAES